MNIHSGPATAYSARSTSCSGTLPCSVTSDSQGGIPPHIALPDAQPGVVEIWDTIKPEKREPIEGWDAPFDTVSEISPRVKLARRIARTVRLLIDARAPVGLDRRPVRCGDIMVLVRQRGSLFEAIIRALKSEGVEVAGADRLVLTEHIAVMDLMTLADALSLPDDDLALATVLRSPLFGFSDDDLFAIAWDRGRELAARRACAQSPRTARRTAKICRRPAARLDQLGEAARRETPFAFYALPAWRRRRPASIPVTARPGGQRRARRVSQSCLGLRAARDAVVAGLSLPGSVTHAPR